jgi:hypothetical protein
MTSLIKYCGGDESVTINIRLSFVAADLLLEKVISNPDVGRVRNLLWSELDFKIILEIIISPCAQTNT